MTHLVSSRNQCILVSIVYPEKSIMLNYHYEIVEESAPQKIQSQQPHSTHLLPLLVICLGVCISLKYSITWKLFSWLVNGNWKYSNKIFGVCVYIVWLWTLAIRGKEWLVVLIYNVTFTLSNKCSSGALIYLSYDSGCV